MIHFGSPIEEPTPTPPAELVWHPVFGFMERDEK